MQIRNSAFVFFLISVGFTILAMLAMLLLLRLPFYHLRIRATEQSEEDKQSQKEKPTLRQVEPKVRVLGLSVRSSKVLVRAHRLRSSTSSS